MSPSPEEWMGTIRKNLGKPRDYLDYNETERKNLEQRIRKKRLNQQELDKDEAEFAEAERSMNRKNDNQH